MTAASSMSAISRNRPPHRPQARTSNPNVAGPAPNPPFGRTAGGGGKIQEFNWNGDLVWDFRYGTATETLPHDFTRLPNRNVQLLVKEKKTAAEAMAAGRISSTVEGTDVQPDSLVEFKPHGKTDGDGVWEWHLWDRLIQDVDKDRANYGDVAAHPERVDINYGVVAGQRANPVWTHFNAVADKADHDQVLVSLRNFSEIWILDHATTTREAAGRMAGNLAILESGRSRPSIRRLSQRFSRLSCGRRGDIKFETRTDYWS